MMRVRRRDGDAMTRRRDGATADWRRLCWPREASRAVPDGVAAAIFFPEGPAQAPVIEIGRAGRILHGPSAVSTKRGLSVQPVRAPTLAGSRRQ